MRTKSARKAHDCAAPTFHRPRTTASRSTSCGGIVEGMDGREWHDENGWHYEAPRLDPYADRLTLALLDDLSKLLVVHGYQPLRGVALEQMCRTIVHLPQGS